MVTINSLVFYFWLILYKYFFYCPSTLKCNILYVGVITQDEQDDRSYTQWMTKSAQIQSTRNVTTRISCYFRGLLDFSSDSQLYLPSFSITWSWDQSEGFQKYQFNIDRVEIYRAFIKWGHSTLVTQVIYESPVEGGDNLGFREKLTTVKSKTTRCCQSKMFVSSKDILLCFLKIGFSN